jgi:biopolymer transport protein ExbD
MAGGGGGEEGEFGLQIAPMLDVLFVLLLFFMVSAGSQQKEEELGLKIPGTGAPSHPGTQSIPLVVTIRSDDTVLIEGSVVGQPEDIELLALRDRLKGIIERFDKDQAVILAPEAEARHSRLVQVLDACSYAGVEKLSFRQI